MSKPRNGPRALVQNAGDKAQVERAKEVETSRDERQRGAWATVMQTPAGRFVLADVLWHCGVQHTVYHIGGNLNDTLFLAGRQDVGRFIEAHIGLAGADDLYLTLTRERHALDGGHA